MNRLFKLSAILLVIFSMACQKPDCPTKPIKPTTDNQSKECSIRGTIISLDCVGDLLGIMDEDNNYYYIEVDKTKEFTKYKEGDEVCFNYEYFKKGYSREVIPGFNTVAATPIYLTCIGQCKRFCPTVKIVDQLAPNSTPNLSFNILETRQDGNLLKMKLGFSGCDSNIEPELLVSLDRLKMSPIQNYDCIMKVDKLQMCEAYFTKEFCFDISKLMMDNAQTFELTFQTNAGMKTVQVVK